MAPTTDALAALRDIHLPEAVSLWPLAPGWWAMLLLFLVLAASLYLVSGWRRRSIKRAALREIEAVQHDFGSTGDLSELAVSLSCVLRRVSLARFARAEVAGLYGDDWLGFLAESGTGTGFPADVGVSIALAVYAGPNSILEPDGDAWIVAARDWIRRIS